MRVTAGIASRGTCAPRIPGREDDPTLRSHFNFIRGRVYACFTNPDIPEG